MAKRKTAKLPPFDKYFYYHSSVQSPDTDVEFIRDVYKELRKKKPVTLREDFCGTFAISCEWVKLSKDFRAIGVDLDTQPIEYGKGHYLSQLAPSQAERVQIINANVLNPELPSADIIAAMNFSYFIFKTRDTLREYFASCRKALNGDGLFLVDCFGGSACTEPNEEETIHDHWSYYWDQDSFDPVTNYAQFYIHFKRKGEKKVEKAFSYDWRMWSIPEIREVMLEAGFEKTYVYWEGTTKDGEGDGNFTLAETGEDCESWVSYIVGA